MEILIELLLIGCWPYNRAAATKLKQIQFKPYQVPENCSSNCLYTISCTTPKKKTRTRVQIKDVQAKTFKDLFLKHKSKYLCCGLQNKIIKTPFSRTTKVHVIKACQNHV